MHLREAFSQQRIASAKCSCGRVIGFLEEGKKVGMAGRGEPRGEWKELGSETHRWEAHI